MAKKLSLFLILIWICTVYGSCGSATVETNTTQSGVAGIYCTPIKTVEFEVTAYSQSSFICQKSTPTGLQYIRTCDDYCLHNITSTNETLICNGDGNYCINHTCSYSGWNCYCQSLMLISKKKVDCGMGFFEPDSTRTIQTCSALATWPGPISLLNYNYVTPEDVFNINVQNAPYSVTFSVKDVARIKYLILQSVLLSQFGTIPLVNYTIINPVSTTSKRSGSVIAIELTGNEDVHCLKLILTNDTLTLWSRTYDSEVNLTSHDICNAGYCEYCDEGVSTWNCHASNFGYMNIGLIIFGAVILCCALPWILACCTVCGKITKCVCYPVFKFSGSKLEKIKENRNKGKDEVKQALKDYDQRDPSVLKVVIEDKRDGFFSHFMKKPETEKREIFEMNEPKSSRFEAINYPTEDGTEPKTGIKKSKVDFGSFNSILTKDREPQRLYVFLFLGLFMIGGLSSVDAQCTSNILATASTQVCSRHNSTHLSCLFKPVVTFGISGPGDHFCINFITNTSDVIGTMDLEFDSLVMKTDLVKEYYTSDWRPVTESSKSCFLESCCDYGQYGSCTDWLSNSVNDPNPCAKFSTYIMSLPGRTGCDAYSGCAGNGCFSCAESCNYFRGALLPTGEVAKIMSPGLSTTEASFTLNTNFSEASSFQFSSSQPLISTNDFTFQLQGVFIDFQVNFGAKKFAQYENNVRIVDAASANSPIESSLGDIQANEADDLGVNLNPSSVIFDAGIMQEMASSDGVNFAYKQPGINLMGSYPALPTSFDGFLWMYNPITQQVEANIDRRLTALITLTATRDFQFYTIDDEVCPSASLVDVVGCYSCVDGGVIEIKAHSNCQPGNCLVTLENNMTVVNNVISLTNSEQNFNVTFLSALKDVQTKMHINCKGNDFVVDVNGTLLSKNTIFYNGDDTFVKTTNSEGKFSWGSLPWFNDLTGLSSIWSTILYAAILVVVSIIIIAVILKLASLSYNKVAHKDSSFADAMKYATGFHAMKHAWNTERFKTAGYEPVSTKDDRINVDY